MLRKKIKPQQILIGWNEKVSLPEWGIKGIRAKMDTGARTSSLHVSHLEFLPQHKKVRFSILGGGIKSQRKSTVVGKVIRISKVKTSSKHKEYRFFVKTTMKLGSVERPIEINLVDRSGMNYPMLLGRTALAGRFFIDPRRSMILTKAFRKSNHAQRKVQ